MNIAKIKAAVIIAIIILICAIIFFSLDSDENYDIVYWHVFDIDGDGTDELFVISNNGGKKTIPDTGEEYGRSVEVYSKFGIVNGVPETGDVPDFIFDLESIKPIMIQSGDIDGDGSVEIALCVYKTTEFHPVLAKRPFFYSLSDGELKPFWLGSRLARPFEDYILYDLDRDDIDEIISIEHQADGSRVIAIYDWRNFGFELKTVSESFDGGLEFSINRNYPPKEVTLRNILKNDIINYSLYLDGETLMTDAMKN